MRVGSNRWTLPGSIALALMGVVGLALAPARAAAQAMRPVEPFHVAGNIYFVGDSDVAVFLITGSQGHILLDTGYERSLPQVESSIEKLGFDVDDIRIILNSHAHFDHAGGHAALKARTRAEVMASRGDVAMLEAGGVGDPVLGDSGTFPPVHVDHVLEDGEVVRLGDIRMVANLTAGHTEGCTSWSTQVMVDGQTRNAVFICSLTILPSARLTGPNASFPGIVDAFRHTYSVLRGLDCEVFLASHSAFFGLSRKLDALKSGVTHNPFVDPEGCSAFIDRGEAQLEQRLAQERALGRAFGSDAAHSPLTSGGDASTASAFR
jgi:metallo-beta-lactamase class B